MIPENALLSEREFHVGQNVSVKCREGFLLRGNGVITCNPDETWTQTNAKCESEWMGRAPWRPTSVEGSSISQIFLMYILFTISMEGEEGRRREEGMKEARRKKGGVTQSIHVERRSEDSQGQRIQFRLSYMLRKYFCLLSQVPVM